MATVASLATSSAGADRISTAAVDQNVVYVHGPVVRLPGSFSEKRERFFTSPDAGVTWRETEPEEIPDVRDRLRRQPELPKLECSRIERAPCYRITGLEKIEESTNGGVTTKHTETVPLGRREFMHRPRGLRLLPGPPLELAPRDIVVLDRPPNHTVIAAMGYEGVFVKGEDGTWRRFKVGNASPTPRDLREEIPRYGTTTEALVGGFLLTLLLTTPVFLLPEGALLAALTGGFLLFLKWAGYLNQAVTGRALVGMVFGWCAFALWAFGLIPLYQWAMALAGLIGLGTVVWCLRNRLVPTR